MRIRYAEIAVIFIGLFSPDCQGAQAGRQGFEDDLSAWLH